MANVDLVDSKYRIFDMDNQRESPSRDSERYLKLKHERIQEIKRDGVPVSVAYSEYQMYPYFTFHPQDRSKIDDLLSQEKYVLEVCLENGHPILQFSSADAYLRLANNPFEPPKLFIHPIPDDLQLNTTKRHFIAKKNASISVHKSVLSSLKFDEEALTGQCQLIKQFIDEKIAVIPSTKTLTFDAQMDLNGEQNMAIKKVSKNALTFIKGPPGCGKTKTIGRICKLMVQKKQKVMVGTVSNTGNLSILREVINEVATQFGVDLVSQLMRIKEDPYYIPRHEQYFNNAQFRIRHKIVLFTNLQSQQQNLKYDPVTRYFTLNQWIMRTIMKINFSKDLTAQQIQQEMDKLTTFDKSKQKSNFFGKVYSLYRQALKKVIEEADILITTTVLSYRIHQKVGNVITRGKYNERPYCPDVVILDEASQATWADTLCFLSFNAGRMVLVGDQQQLDPTVISQDALLKQTVFSTLSQKNQDYFQMLRTQYRMHPQICEFPNVFFYDGKLKNGVKPQQRQSDLYFFSDHPLAFLNHLQPEQYYQQSDTGKKNYYNSFEIKCIDTLLSLFPAQEYQNIGIISPYGLQVKKLIQKFKHQVAYGLTIKTCDGYQGGEKDYIFFSCVRSNEQGKIGFCAEPNRINVSLTRARKSLTIIGNMVTLSSEAEITADKNVWKALISYLDAKKKIISALSVFQEIAYYKSITYETHPPTLQEHIEKTQQENQEYTLEYYKQLYDAYKQQENVSEEVKIWMREMEKYHGDLVREAEKIEKEDQPVKEVSQEEKIKEAMEKIQAEKGKIKDQNEEEEENLKSKNKKEAREIRRLLSSFCKSQIRRQEDIDKLIDNIRSLFEKPEQTGLSLSVQKLTKKTCDQFISKLKVQTLPNCTNQLKKVLSGLNLQLFSNNHIYQADLTYKIIKIGVYHQLIFLLF